MDRRDWFALGRTTGAPASGRARPGDREILSGCSGYGRRSPATVSAPSARVGPVFHDHEAAGVRGRADQLEVALLGDLVEPALADRDDRLHPQVVLVDQAKAGRRLDQLG